MAKRKRRTGRWVLKDDRLFTLEVALIGGPVTEEFVDENPVVSRTIEIRGDQTLEELHYAIFEDFDREDEHLYEFQVGGKGPTDPKARRYVLRGEFNNPIPGSRKPAGDVSRTSVGSLNLKVDDAFGYWFDFGDDWWHQINVVVIQDEAPEGTYPRVTKRVGASPPQYPNWDEEHEWGGEDDENGWGDKE
jgi:hypothetical protein